jgi:23S rRNA (guanosine2251-2'-O)-methyltransferase
MTPRKPAAHRRNSSAKPPHRTGAPGGPHAAHPVIRAKGYWLYGRHAVTAALTNVARRKYRLVATENAARDLGRLPPSLAVDLVRSPRDIDALLPPGSVHQGLALDVAPLDGLTLDDVLDAVGPGPAVILVLDQVTDPHNVGAILRSAAAFSAAAVITTERQAAAESGALAKAASGALDLVPYVCVVNLVRALDQLADAGFWRVGLEGETQALLTDSVNDARIVLVMGAEGAGLRRLTREHCDVLAKLPMSGTMESLNVSNAAAIALYECARRGKD